MAITGFQERFLNIYVLDVNQRPIPGAKVTAFVKGRAVAEATTLGTVSDPVRVQIPKNVSTLDLQAEVEGVPSQRFSVDTDSGNFKFTFSDVRLPNESGSTQIGTWIFGSVLLAFLMFLVLRRPVQVTSDQQNLIRLLAACFGGIIASFFIGSLNLGGKVPMFKNLHIRAVGGFGVFALILFTWR